jgi:hypothetical protein
VLQKFAAPADNRNIHDFRTRAVYGAAPPAVSDAMYGKQRPGRDLHVQRVPAAENRFLCRRRSVERPKALGGGSFGMTD